jgi:RHS repeat-associated protein
MFTLRKEQIAVLAKHFNRGRLAARLAEKGFETAEGEGPGELLVRDARGKQARLSLDDRGHLTQVVGPLGLRHVFAYDGRGRLTAVTLPNGLQTTVTYDGKGRPTAVTRGQDRRWLFEWDDFGNVSTLTLPDQTTLWRTAVGPKTLSRVVNGAGEAVELQRGENGLLLGLVEATGARSRFEYGKWDRPDRTVRADGSAEEVTRDDAGRIVAATAGGRPWFKVEYSGGGRMAAIRYTDGHFVEFTYNGAGLVTEARNPHSVVKLKYDGRQRLVEEDQAGQVVRYRYDAAGLLVGLTTPAGDEVRFAYDDEARLVGVEDWDGQKHVIDYEGAGQVVRHLFPNGVTTVVRLLPTGRPGEIRTGDPRAGSAALVTRFEHTLTDQVQVVADSEGGTRRYSYDAAGRVTRVERVGPGGTVAEERFAYDGSGNRVEAGGERAEVNPVNQVTRQGGRRFAYDARGNLVEESGSGGTTRYQYDGQNQLVRVALPSGESVEYLYDAFGRRIAKRAGGAETRYVWSMDRLLGESVKGGGGAERRDYLFLPGGHTPLSVRVNGVTYQYHTDPRGAPRRLTGPAGEVVWSATYSAFGRLTVFHKAVRQPLRFPGQYHDEETQLCYNRARYYSPDLGRYLSRDPLDLVAGVNLYMYAGNDPVNGSDPLGLFDWAGGALFAAGIAVGAVAIAVCLPAVALTAAGLAAAAVVVGGAALVTGSVAGLVADVETDGNRECEEKAFLTGTKQGAEVGAGVAIMVASAGTAGPVLGVVGGGGMTTAGIAVTTGAVATTGATATMGVATGAMMSQGAGSDSGGGKDEEPAQPKKKGTIDESEKQFSPEEKKIADKLTEEGKDVKALKEVEGQRNGDALVDGKPTEFKTMDPGATDATVKNQINNSVRGGGQARDMILDARGSGLSEDAAQQGLNRASNITRGRIDSVRIIGDGYDTTSTNFK